MLFFEIFSFYFLLNSGLARYQSLSWEGSKISSIGPNNIKFQHKIWTANNLNDKLKIYQKITKIKNAKYANKRLCNSHITFNSVYKIKLIKQSESGRKCNTRRKFFRTMEYGTSYNREAIAHTRYHAKLVINKSPSSEGLINFYNQFHRVLCVSPLFPECWIFRTL